MVDASAGPTAPLLSSIARPYLLCLNIKSYRDRAGRRYLDRLWHRDLAEHTRYLENLTLAAPCQASAPPPDAVLCEGPLDRVRFVDLPAPNSLPAAILHLPSTVATLWREIGGSSLVHLGVAGWPIPLGWLAAPLARMRRKPYLIVVESAPWRIYPGMPASAAARFRAWYSERCSRWCVRRASLVIATQREYLAMLENPAEGHIIQASWLHDEDIVSDGDAAAAWRAKAAAGPLKLLFAGRLVPSKGVPLLLEAMRSLHAENAAIELDVLGEGELLEECQRTGRALDGVTRVRAIGAVPYGEAFFRLLRNYHAVAVPSLSDEQPRIVYDAYSQAVPVLAGNTSGLRECVEDGRTGLIAAAPDAAAWTRVLRWSCRHGGELERMGLAALQIARQMTHRRMHDERWRLLLAIPEA